MRASAHVETWHRMWKNMGVLCADPKACAYGAWVWEQPGTGLDVREWGGARTQSMCVHGWWHDSCPWDGHTSCMSAVFLLGRGELQEARARRRVKRPPLFPVPTCQEVGASKVLAGPRGLPTVNTGDSAALACFPPVPRSGVSTWRRMLRAVGHLAELPGSRSKNVEADSFTGQGPHPRRAKARRCTGHAGELVIPVPTNCVHM